ncbi:MAG: Hsp20/alpha crystallin family protein [Thermoleophilaceae bacterium]
MTLLMKPEPFSSEINRLFNTLFDDGRLQQRWVPAMDLVESDEQFVLRADLPGLSEDDVSIEIRDNTLTISGERKSEFEQKERGWYRVERSTGAFSRSLALPEGIDAGAVSAEFDKGVLEVRIPKPEQRKPRRVEIRASSANGSGHGRPAAVEGTATEQTAA